MGTFVRILKGCKYWYVAVTMADGTAIDTWRMQEYWEDGETFLDTIKLFKWELVILREGSSL